MAAPQLQHYKGVTAANVALTVVPAVPSLRALIVTKVTVANGNGSAATVSVSVGGRPIVESFPLPATSVYAETGLVVLAGETVTVTTSQACHVNVFGLEQDRG